MTSTQTSSFDLGFLVKISGENVGSNEVRAGAQLRQLKVSIASAKSLPVQRVNPRDHFSVQQLGDVETAERVAAGQLRRQAVYGNAGAERVVLRSAAYTRRLLDGEIDIPGLSGDA
jgi:hypothetical protein